MTEDAGLPGERGAQRRAPAGNAATATLERTVNRAGDGPAAPAARRLSLGRRIWRERWMYTFIVPGLLFFVVFHYLPLGGIVIAFQDYSPFLGFAGSTWVGAENFTRLVGDPEFWTTVSNTLIISGLQIVFAFPAPILLALLLNSLLSERVKRVVQSIVYLPHFISWVIVISIWQQVLGGAGPVSDLVQTLGAGHVNIMANAETFKLLLTSQVIWKDIGWGTIIFFAAISSIPNELYESAAADGAGSLRRTWHITLPGILPVVVLLLILRLGDVLSVGFEQILLQQPTVGVAAAQVLDTFVYFRGVQGGDWGIGAAAGLIKGVVGTALIITANAVAKKTGNEGLI